MVGIPRSKGCLTCISRRVKCDESRPECLKCKRGGRKCAGYNRPTKFVNMAQTQPEAPQQSRKKSQLSTTSSRSSQSPEFSSGTELALVSSPYAELQSPDTELAQSLSIFIASLSPSNTTLVSPHNPNGGLKLFTAWMSFIPSYLGKSSALDGAVACLSLHSMGSVSGNPELSRESFRFYGKALNGLRRSLKSDDTALTAETLCATMILSIYELFACTKEYSWIQHAGGASQLMRARGAARHMTGFERSMFYAFRGLTLLASVASCTSSFLELPEWKAVAMSPNHELLPVESLVEEFYQTATSLPRLRKEVKLLLAGKGENISRQRLVSEIISLQIFLDNCINNLRLISSQPWETLSSKGDELFPFVYKFGHNSTASLFCHCKSFSLMTRRFLAELGIPGWNSNTIRSGLIDDICKTVEFAMSKTAGIFGLFYIIFGLTIAYGTAKGPVKSWIEDKLATIAKVMPVARIDPKEDVWEEVEEIQFIEETEVF